MIPAAHVHISEREVAHTWPDGRSDDARWEDCAFDTAVEWVRVVHDPQIPATHVEAEALRAASGLGPSGGATIERVRAGLQARYGFAGTKVLGFAALWAALTPGTAACVQGSMGAFPAGHRLRRHSPSFVGIHQITAFRPDTSERAWWCDPLAPAGVGYTGEWVTKAELAAYVNGFAANGHTVAPYKEVSMIPVPSGSFAHVANKRTSVTATTANFRAERRTDAAILKAYPMGTAVVPVAQANDGSSAGGLTPTRWYAAFMYDDSPAGVVFGWFHSSVLGPLVDVVKPGYTKAEMDAAIAAAKGAIKTKVAAGAAALAAVAADVAND